MYTWFHAQRGFHKPEIDADDDASEADAAVADIISKADADDDGDTEDSTTTALIISVVSTHAKTLWVLVTTF